MVGNIDLQGTMLPPEGRGCGPAANPIVPTIGTQPVVNDTLDEMSPPELIGQSVLSTDAVIDPLDSDAMINLEAQSQCERRGRGPATCGSALDTEDIIHRRTSSAMSTYAKSHQVRRDRSGWGEVRLGCALNTGAKIDLAVQSQWETRAHSKIPNTQVKATEDVIFRDAIIEKGTQKPMLSEAYAKMSSIPIDNDGWAKISGTPIDNGANTSTNIESGKISVVSSVTNSATRSAGENSLAKEDHRTDKFMDPELYRAATKNDANNFIVVLEQVAGKHQLSLDAVLNQVSPLENTLLHVAVSFAKGETARRIVSRAPWLLAKTNSEGNTALHISAKAGDISMVQLLVSLRREFSGSSSSNNSAGTEREIMMFFRFLRAKNEEENTALHEALINRHQEVALFLIGKDPELAYYVNKEGMSPLYLAAEAGYTACVDDMLEKPIQTENGKLEKNSPVYAAIISKNKDVLDLLLKKMPELINIKDEEGTTPLHFAASKGYLEGVRYLLSKSDSSAMERDTNGSFPIHLASAKGNVDVIKELLKYCMDPWELHNDDGQNILHVAAERGQHNVVSYILNTPEFEKLINERDKKGNTPLHLATMNWHPKIVSALTWNHKVDLKLVNNEGLAALDAAEFYMDRMPPFRKQLTWTALKAAGAPRAPCGKVPKINNSLQLEPPNMDKYKDRVNTLLLVSTLIATVTFAAGFTMPGGYNSSDPDQGMATMLRHFKFHVFIFCNTIAMYSSIIVVVTLIWAQLGDLHLVLAALRFAMPFLGIALTGMSLAFMAGVWLVVSKLTWLANAVLIIALVFLSAIVALYFFLCCPMESSNRIVRYISYYPFCLLVWVVECYTKGNLEE